jgi:hypothetical protein
MLFILTAEAVTTNHLSVLVVIINSYINIKTCGRMRIFENKKMCQSSCQSRINNRMEKRMVVLDVFWVLLE